MAPRYNQAIFSRFSGLQALLMAAHDAGKTMSSASLGAEREAFLRVFLSEVLAPPYRFGTGDITDRSGKVSGQVDIVIEFPFLPSFPVFGANGPRLYLADGTAAAIEVKSDLKNQWKETVLTAEKIASLRRTPGAYVKRSIERVANIAVPPATPREKIPVLAVGYRGWRLTSKYKSNMLKRLESCAIDAVLQVDAGTFITNPAGELSGVPEAIGPFAFWAFTSAVHQATTYIEASGVRLIDYLDSQAKVIPPFSDWEVVDED